MRYNYPYRLYLLFLLIFIFVACYGLYMIYEATFNYIELRILYILFSIAIIVWYYEKYNYYYNRYVIINDNGITISFGNNREAFSSDEIDCIILANHKGCFKIYNVIHIFLRNNKYFYITNEINKYKDLKNNIRKYFPEKFHIKDTLVPINFSFDKHILLDDDF